MRVEHDVADPGAQRLAQLAARTWRCRAGRSAPGSKPPPAPARARRRRRHRRRAPPPRARGRPPCTGTPWRRTARRCRGAVRADRAERAGASAQIVLGDHVRGGAELRRELERVAATELQVAALVDPAAERVDVREVGGAGAHRTANDRSFADNSGRCRGTGHGRCRCRGDAPSGPGRSRALLRRSGAGPRP